MFRGFVVSSVHQNNHHHLKIKTTSCNDTKRGRASQFKQNVQRPVHLPLAYISAVYMRWIGWDGGDGRRQLDVDITCGDGPFCWCDGDLDISACGGVESPGICGNC
eukprot:scaffold27127_cov74-Cyclotella_meneghiniana.AAC.2